MKTLNLLTVLFLFILFSCSSQVSTNAEKVNFGIFETVKTNEIPDYILDSIKAKNVRLKNNPQSAVIGYILKSDLSVFQLDFSKENIKLVKTFNTVDASKVSNAIDLDSEYYAITAIKPTAVMNISDISKTKVNENNVYIYFNLKGARKWADMTKNNVGNMVAFVIDNQIYSMPRVNSEIRKGIAMISGLENEIIAKEISESLNASRTE
jgi:preprotein translocase subunit SecD